MAIFVKENDPLIKFDGSSKFYGKGVVTYQLEKEMSPPSPSHTKLLDYIHKQHRFPRGHNEISEGHSARIASVRRVKQWTKLARR